MGVGMTRRHDTGWGWVQAGDEEGFDPNTVPAQTLTSKTRSWPLHNPVGFWQWHRPATTVCGDPRITARCHHGEGTQGANPKTTAQVQDGDYDGTEPIKLTVEEALILQGFRPDYPLQGSRSKQFEQIGNAVPPPLAAAILNQLIAPIEAA